MTDDVQRTTSEDQPDSFMDEQYRPAEATPERIREWGYTEEDNYLFKQLARRIEALTQRLASSYDNEIALTEENTSLRATLRMAADLLKREGYEHAAKSVEASIGR